MILWSITIGLNIALALVLLFRNHVTRYRILFLSLIFEIAASPVLHWIYGHYGTNSAAYYDAFHAKKMLTILFAFGIIWEGFAWGNRCVRIPSEIYLLALLAMFLTEKAQFFTAQFLIYQSMRWVNLGMILFWGWCFSKGERNERREVWPQRR